MIPDQHHKPAEVIHAGKPAAEAKKAAILLHGRGASAQSILALADHLPLQDFHLVAPQADRHTWYPYSFMAPRSQNQPGLDSALELLETLLKELQEHGLKQEGVHLIGFSQGACLTLEFAAKIGGKWGSVTAFTGGLIGETLEPAHYADSLAGSRVFIGSSDFDPHVPESRMRESEAWLRERGAQVDLRIYPGLGHTINADEVAAASMLLEA